MSNIPRRYGAYAQITDILRTRIKEGVYSPESKLPSEAELCEEFGFSRGPVRRALMTLQNENLIRVAMGVGRFVCAPSGSAPVESTGPRYQLIAAELRARIEKGEFRPGELLPGELPLSSRYGASRHTVQSALDELETAGLVVRVQGRGRMVKPKTSPDDPVASVDVR